ncbi:Uncharacterised protein [Leminorella richardii]|uniref:Uncharacterized protein n=1 Tax=Leminorella richardii TaxID=158841 RepID=A0A2X4XL80_9GAMM|nr:Uncharacterised protein [Leminorella richardii]
MRSTLFLAILNINASADLLPSQDILSYAYFFKA